uniref:DUF985 domain-containing protein n=1 Tax=Chlorobium chlorochromatii (strain CaD3) TaxID=340177 RepID=Q3ATW2_CHLCH
MDNALHWINCLQLQPHPEGGYYRETYRSSGNYSFSDSAPQTSESTFFQGERSYATAIYYLLQSGERSRLHRIHSDELWFYHAGAPLTVHIFPETGEPSCFTLGLDVAQGEVPQAWVPAGAWFGASGASLKNASVDDYALVSCVVAPGFDFRDFTFADRHELLRKFPQYSTTIERLT